MLYYSISKRFKINKLAKLRRQVGYILQKYTLDKYTFGKYTFRKHRHTDTDMLHFGSIQQGQKNPVRVSALPTGKFLMSRKFLRVFIKSAQKTSKKTQDWKDSRHSGKFLDSVESLWTVLKVSGKFPDSMESFQTI